MEAKQQHSKSHMTQESYCLFSTLMYTSSSGSMWSIVPTPTIMHIMDCTPTCRFDMARASVVLEVSWPASSTSSRLCVISWSVSLQQASIKPASSQQQNKC
jgi:hypothetical protein